MTAHYTYPGSAVNGNFAAMGITLGMFYIPQ
jgi:hypothetical protein